MSLLRISLAIAFLCISSIFRNVKADIVINEIDYDNIGTDSFEFIELYNNGLNTVNISDYVIGLINGGSNTFYDVFEIPDNTSLAAGAYYVLGSTNFTGLNQYFSGAQTDRVQNGAPDAVGLYSGIGSGVGTTIVNGGASTIVGAGLVDGIVYETTSTNVNMGNYPGFAQSSLADSNSSNISFGRLANGTGNFALTASPTPGAANLAPVPELGTLCGWSTICVCVGIAALRRRRLQAV